MKVNFFSDINKDIYDELGYKDTDKLLLKILWWHFAVLLILALAIYLLKPAEHFLSPWSYRVLSLNETAIVIILGLLTSSVMVILRNRFENHYHYRVLMTAALIMYSYLFVFTTGGSIEAHFHFFVIFALLCIYCDWRLGIMAAVLTALHHGILNYIAPNWVYYYGRNDFSIVAHAMPVIVAILFTTWICENGRKSVMVIKISNKEEMSSKAKMGDYSKNLEKKVEEKTKELKEKIEELEQFNKFAVGRELKMLELKKRLKELEDKLGKEKEAGS